MDITNFTPEAQLEKQQKGMKIILADEETPMPIKKEASQLNITSSRGRVAIFIDGSNLFHTALQLGIEIDYTKLLCCLTRESRLLRAFFYTGVDRHNEKQQGFLLWMRRNGYRVVTKEIIQLPDGSRKSNQHVEIAVDMMNLTPYYDTAVLVSGDGELTYAVNAVAYEGARVELRSSGFLPSPDFWGRSPCGFELGRVPAKRICRSRASSSNSVVSIIDVEEEAQKRAKKPAHC